MSNHYRRSNPETGIALLLLIVLMLAIVGLAWIVWQVAT